jgi:hypothetical protein
MITLLNGKLTLRQRREILGLAGWLAALVGCVQYDSTDRTSAEATRQAAWKLGDESGNAEVMAWARRCGRGPRWHAGITGVCWSGGYRACSGAGRGGGGAVACAEAKAWARAGDRRQVEVALDQGRALLEGLLYPENLDNHFCVDPAKWDFYSMDCYRILGGLDAGSTENKLAGTQAREILRGRGWQHGFERSPMRNAEARVKLGVPVSAH